jgi:hypothetical protein
LSSLAKSPNFIMPYIKGNLYSIWYLINVFYIDSPTSYFGELKQHFLVQICVCTTVIYYYYFFPFSTIFYLLPSDSAKQSRSSLDSRRRSTPESTSNWALEPNKLTLYIYIYILLLLIYIYFSIPTILSFFKHAINPRICIC